MDSAIEPIFNEKVAEKLSLALFIVDLVNNCCCWKKEKKKKKT